MIGKLIVHDKDRASALAKARRCLDEIVIEGPRTNIPFVRRIIDHPEFAAGDFDTGFVGRMLAERAEQAAAHRAKAN
jgi:acetyl-CoA carboxylase, biotin carboxylase subunit